MINRVTTQMSMAAAQRNLQAGAVRLATLQSQASTLKNITVPSDDPTGTGQSMLVRSQQAATAQYTRNASDGVGWLDTTDAALGDVSTIMNRVRDLTVQGANDGSLSDTARSAIADELDGLKQDLLQAANTQYGGRSVFAGSSDSGAAYGADFTWTGGSGATGSGPVTAPVTRRLDTGTTVRVDTDGSAVFGTGADSVFSLIDGISSDLRSGVNVGARLTAIDARTTTMRAARSDVGARETQVQRAQTTLASRTTSLEAQRSGIEDKDIAKAVLDLQLQQTNYQAALAVTAKVLKPTLMDFLS